MGLPPLAYLKAKTKEKVWTTLFKYLSKTFFPFLENKTKYLTTFNFEFLLAIVL